MIFAIANIEATDRSDFVAEFMAERLIEKRMSHPFPHLWVAMFRPVEPWPGAELVLAVHYQPTSIQDLATGDWFTAREVRGFYQEDAWTAFRTTATHRLQGMYIGPSQFVRES